MSFGSRLEERRGKLGLNQKQFAKLAGINYTTYNGYARDRTEPSLSALVQMAKLLNCSTDYLLGRTDDYGAGAYGHDEQDGDQSTGLKNYTVYAIQCTTNRKIYIGATCDFQARIYAHFSDLKGGRHAAKSLQGDYNRYGKDSFQVYLIESELPFETYRGVEQDYIEKYKTRNPDYGYNIKHQGARDFDYIVGKPLSIVKSEATK